MSALLAKGQGASPGVASGPLVTTPEAAIALAQKGTPAVLVRTEASAEDVDAIRVCAALVTTRGGITGDGAIAARALGKPCLTGVPSMRVDYTKREVHVTAEGAAPVVLSEGEIISVDATGGTISRG